MSEIFQFDAFHIYHLRIPMQRPFITSMGALWEKEFVVFEGRCGDYTGWGEAAVDGIPFYTAETAETAVHVAQRVIIPLLKKTTWDHPAQITTALNSFRGHTFAKAAFEAVAWDIYGQAKGRPVWQLLGGTREWVENGPSIGLKESPGELVTAVQKEVTGGSRRIKIKVTPGKDSPYIFAVRDAFPHITLMVDANSAYRPEDIPLIQSWDTFNLLMIEQPLPPDDLYYHAQLRRRCKTPICLDESIGSTHLADCAIQMGAADTINIKVGHVGGLVNTVKAHNMCAAAGMPVWIGSRLGTGLAAAMRFAAASLPNAVYPSDAGFGLAHLESDIIVGDFDALFAKRNGCEYKLPMLSGMGVQVDRDKMEPYILAVFNG
ncbi:MAG: o-succinylbenzoate synthase [Chloroflexi bacterium]|nr:o-succinylbenzoate synthase [Chloroflexota bacterium]